MYSRKRFNVTSHGGGQVHVEMIVHGEPGKYGSLFASSLSSGVIEEEEGRSEVEKNFNTHTNAENYSPNEQEPPLSPFATATMSRSFTNGNKRICRAKTLPLRQSKRLRAKREVEDEPPAAKTGGGSAAEGTSTSEGPTTTSTTTNNNNTDGNSVVGSPSMFSPTAEQLAASPVAFMSPRMKVPITTIVDAADLARRRATVDFQLDLETGQIAAFLSSSNSRNSNSKCKSNNNATSTAKETVPTDCDGGEGVEEKEKEEGIIVERTPERRPVVIAAIASSASTASQQDVHHHYPEHSSSSSSNHLAVGKSRSNGAMVHLQAVEKSLLHPSPPPSSSSSSSSHESENQESSAYSWPVGLTLPSPGHVFSRPMRAHHNHQQHHFGATHCDGSNDGTSLMYNGVVEEGGGGGMVRGAGRGCGKNLASPTFGGVSQSQSTTFTAHHTSLSKGMRSRIHIPLTAVNVDDGTTVVTVNNIISPTAAVSAFRSPTHTTFIRPAKVSSNIGGSGNGGGGGGGGGGGAIPVTMTTAAGPLASSSRHGHTVNTARNAQQGDVSATTTTNIRHNRHRHHQYHPSSSSSSSTGQPLIVEISSLAALSVGSPLTPTPHYGSSRFIGGSRERI